VSGNGLRIPYFGEKDEASARADDVAPMLAVKSFEFRTGLWALFQPTMRVSLVRVQGLELRIPPKQERAPLLPAEKKQLRNEEEVKPKRSIVLDKIVVSDMTLTIETNKPGKQPLVFAIRDVTLHDVGPGRPFPYDAQLVNAKPVGDIHSTGHFGPWRGDDPRDSPIDGDYSFTHADLGTIKGISGTLSSAGKYGGTLGEIGVTGTTDTPDFALDVSEHPVDLRTEFNATVDGTTGDTRLNSVHATLLHTTLQVTGMVMRAGDSQGKDGQGQGGLPGDNAANAPGHFIDINVASNQARVEDLLRLAAKTSPPLMKGAMTLKAKLQIPPGHVSVSKKMRVQGTFTIRGVTFSNPKWQDTVDKLSERAQGHPQQANAQDATLALSDMSGRFALASGTLNASELNYQVPGAQVNLTGKYTLDGQTFDFDGTVRTKATASQMLTGWKSIVAMPLDPLLKKNGAGVEAPIKISGTKSDPKVGLDLGKILSRHKDQPPPGTGQKP
jgi:hypothetical protein